ncbi:amino acid adenylation domain-containing protein [Streptomyces sp. NPDC087658]|uniref:amino acid adenylation domain-containing protein n=1 Tax=Streptomyces sp. NPDC087658 TaxID=3365800 RepID=UPI0038090CE9
MSEFIDGDTLLSVLLDAADEVPEQIIVHVRDDGAERVVTLRELRDESLRVAGGFLAAGVAPGTPVPLLADRGDGFQPLFWGALAAGLVPVPLAGRARLVLPVWELLGRPPVATDAGAASVLDELPSEVRHLRLAELRESGIPDTLPERAAHDIAFLQFSSGSTGSPKGVELTHAGVLANLRQIRTAAALTPDDVVASWMPYFHDMGLIGTHLAPLSARAKQVRIEPLAFAKRPLTWFDTASRHRATLLSAANFALALAVRRVPDEALARLDLSSVRMLLVGAEPIAPTVWRDFARKTRPAGLAAGAPQPVYGLAEATLAVAFPPPGEIAVPLVLDRAALARGRAVDAAPGTTAVELMDVGRPVPGCTVRIVDARRKPLGDRRVGHIEVAGPQVARGYHGLPAETADAFADGWLRTGDLGFLRDGRLCVTGRHKDVLFLNGRTFHAPDLEAVAAATPGLPPGTTAVIGSTDPLTGTERVVVFAQWARPPRATVDGVLDEVAARVREVLAHDEVRVLPLAPGAFPRTTSGKIRRQLLRTRFEAGAYGEGVRRAVRSDGDTGRAPSPSSILAPFSVPVPGPPRSRRDAEETVRRVWARALELPGSAIGAHDRFLALGGSSLRAMRVLGELEDAFGTALPPAVLRDHDTVAALADHLLGRAAAGGSVRASASDAVPDQGVRERRGALAITAVACRFPGADTPEAFWDLLAGGRDAVTPVPPDRWAVPGDTAVRWGAFLDDPTGFDADLFGIDAREAGAIDPQARIFLELAHEALERAGYAGPRRAGRRIGVFAAVGDSGYRELLEEQRGRVLGTGEAGGDVPELERQRGQGVLPGTGGPGRGVPGTGEAGGYVPELERQRGQGVLPGTGGPGRGVPGTGEAGRGVPGPAAFALTGNLPGLVAARVSHALDLDGPALAVDTACSSALVALHLARRSIEDGECDLAVVGGVNLHLTPAGHRHLEAVGALSPTGRSRAFSATADGFVPGEGGAALVLTALDDARRAGDPVLALLRGTAVNNDGRSLSLTAPNPLRQREVIARAYREAGVDPGVVSYVEAHGTGTAIGDPIELKSLAHAFPPRADGRPRLLGSVKTNLGHLLNAAGMPGLLKVVLALGKRQLPASLHHAPLSPGPAAAGFAVVAEHRDWDAPDASDGPLVAGVNAFGFGGTNAHAILEEAPEPPPSPSPPRPGPHLLTLSAHTAPALRAAASGLAARLSTHPALDEGDVCATANTARDDAPYRLAVVADGDLAVRLEASTEADFKHVGAAARTVFLLPGQGAPGPGQSRALYGTAPVFRDTLDEASARVGPVCGRALTDWALDPDAAAEALSRTEVAQPLLVAFGVGLARQLGAWGVRPDAVAGHSVGEIAAACVAGVLDLGDAVGFAAERGRLMAGLTAPGAMAAVRGGEEAVAGVLAASDGALSVAALNGPDQVVIAGGPEAVAVAVAKLAAEGVTARVLPVAYAFHSPLMRPVLAPLAVAARALVLRAPAIPLMSTVTAEWQPVPDAEYLREHAVRPVRFGAAVERMLDAGYGAFLELGGGATLLGPVRAVAAATGRAAPVSLSAALPRDAEGSTGARALLGTVGRLWTHGVPVDRTGTVGTGAASGAVRARVALPVYPLQHRSYRPGEPDRRPLLHRLLWRGEAPAAATGEGPRGIWLLGPDTPLLRALAGRLTARGVPVLWDGAPAAPGDPAPDTAVPGDIDTVVLIAGPAAGLDSVAALDTAQHTALAHFHRIGRLTAEIRPARLLVVTEDVHATGADRERLCPAQALLTGLALALPEEHPGLAAASVDLSSLDTVADRLDALDHELNTPAVPGPTVTLAWRAGRRLIRTPVAVASGEAEYATASPDADGAYLITGGRGGIGTALARDLAGRGRPTLILAGRSPEPPAGLLAELGALGASVRYRVADVSCEADLDALLADLPPLDAVFHAAGVVRPGTLRTKTPQEMAGVLAAKTRGTLLLSLALRRHGHRPAVCVAFSSIASALPGLAGGLGDYAAGNAFLDAFAAAERAAGRPWQSLNFAALTGTGLTEGATVRQAVAARGIAPLTTGDALTALRTAHGIDAAQLLVAELLPVSAPSPAVPPRSPVGVSPSPVEPPRTFPTPGQVVSGVAEVVRRLLAVALDRTPGSVPDDEPFLAMGLDSLAAVDLVKQLERQLELPLPATLFFEYRTIRELAAHIEGAIANGPDPVAITGPVAADPATPFPLTPVQLAFHANGRLHPDVGSYGYVRQTVTGPLDAELLGEALALLAERHPMLRIRIRPAPDGDGPRQSVVPAGPVSDWYEVRDLGTEGGGPEERLCALEEALCNRPFDLAAEPPVRAVLVRESGGPAHLVLVIHHAAGDGYSLNVLGEELWQVYTALARGRTPELPPIQTDFAAYAEASRAERSAPAFTADLRYWREALAARDAEARLPYDGDPDTPPAPPLVSHQTAIDAALTAALRKHAAAHGVSLFHLMLAAYAHSLVRWSGQRTLTVNVARARRETRLTGVERLVGPLADTLPLFIEAGPGEPVRALAERLRPLWLESERHATPGSLDLARLLPTDRRGPRTAGQVGFSFAHFPTTDTADRPVTVRSTAAGTASAATRLSLLCWEDGATLRFSWNFPATLFDRGAVARLAGEHLAELAELGTQEPRPVRARGIAERLGDRFRATPDAVAVDTGGGSGTGIGAGGGTGATLTYAALDRASAALAARLRSRGVSAGDLVGLLTEQGADTVVGVVGILRAGAGWVPMDAGHPPARLADQLRRTGARTVVCHPATRTTAEAVTGAVPLALDDPTLDQLTYSEEELGPVGAPDPDAVAYVIFTSGSTGRPKAVPITHRSLENYLDWALDTFGYRAGDRLAQTAAVCFDASVRQLLAPLLVGATVVTVPRDLVRDPELLLDHVERAGITVWSSVPTLWERLLAAAEARVREGLARPDLSALRWIHVGGEALPAGHVRRWFDLFGAGQRIANLYGPTEATINATCHLIDARPGDDVLRLPIGRPLTGTRVVVVDERGRACAPGEPGELFIAGTGLTPGYLGEPALTAAAFTERDGARWYRSGDRVRHTADGTLEFLGRLDDQLKIRGHRVEPGEIEAVLQTHPGVARAVVVHRDNRLTAYVEPRHHTPAPDPAALRAHLSAVLPDYMLPARIESLDLLPLTGTGKVDRRQLAPTTGTDAGSARSGRGTAPATPTESLLARIWGALLDVPDVCGEDDFFALGGDSLLVLEVFARLEKEITVLPRPTVIYTHGTLAALAAAIDGAGPPDVRDPAPYPNTDASEGGWPSPYPLTPTQRGFLLADALAPEGDTGWLARLRLRGTLRPGDFQGAVDALVAHHPMLRTVFPAGARPPVQQELPPSMRLPVDFETLSTPALLDERVAEERRRRFESWTWPLLRLRVLTVAPDEHVLVVHAHHLIGDGYSAALFGRELLAAYDRLGRGEPAAPPPSRTTFRDYAALLERPLSARAVDPAADARQARLDAPYRPPVLRTDEGTPGHNGGFTLDVRRTAGLRRSAAVAGATLYAPVLTAYYRALTGLTGRQDLVLGLAVTGREVPLPDVNRLFGPLATAVALRPAAPGTDEAPGKRRDFDADCRRIIAEVAAARTQESAGPRLPSGLPLSAQFFFTFLDFSALDAVRPEPDGPSAGTLTLSWDDGDTELAPPPLGTDVFLAARPTTDGGLRITLRTAAGTLTPEAFAALLDTLRHQLDPVAGTGPDRKKNQALDAALVGYLPSPDQLARLAGLPAGALPREELRSALFPDAEPRLLEEMTTSLGRSGFVCLPLFADELLAGEALAGHTARAVAHAASLGARCVSLAGMIPALTGYGFGVLRAAGPGTAVTTGHAATAVSVVRTVHAALDATGRRLGELAVAVVGLGSIGSSSLELLLSLAPAPPYRLLLCDVAGSGPRLKALAEELRARGLAGAVETRESDPGLPAAVYGADLVITAVSGGGALLDIDGLRPGTIVVDDSFPHCFDTARAIDRMRSRRDVLVVGGGLFALDDTERQVADGLPAQAAAGYEARSWLPGTIASCRVESLLRATDAQLPLVHGLVDGTVAHTYWHALEAAGVRAAPLHLLDHVVGPEEMKDFGTGSSLDPHDS